MPPKHRGNTAPSPSPSPSQQPSTAASKPAAEHDEHAKWMQSPYFSDQVALVVGLQRVLPLWLQHAISLSSLFGSGPASFIAPSFVLWWVDPLVRT